MTSTTPINFVCLKWGTKYGPEYVNRLYRAIKGLFSGEFRFYCYTDSSVDLDIGIEVREIRDLDRRRLVCFTAEKLLLFNQEPFLSGRNVFLDIDLLVLKDLYPYLKEYDFVEPRFTVNDQPDIDYKSFADIHSQYGPNYVNSSFITWKEDQLVWLLEFYLEHQELINYMYEDLDTFLFHAVKKKLRYHPNEIIYSFNAYWKRLDRSIVFFNTSHGRGVELHEAPEWAQRIWVGSE